MSLFAALNARLSKGSSVVFSSLSDPGRAVPPARSLSFSPGPISSMKSNRRREFDESLQFSSAPTHSFNADPEMGLGNGLGMKTIDENGDTSPTQEYELSTISSARSSERMAHTMPEGVAIQVKRPVL